MAVEVRLGGTLRYLIPRCSLESQGSCPSCCFHCLWSVVYWEFKNCKLEGEIGWRMLTPSCLELDIVSFGSFLSFFLSFFFFFCLSAFSRAAPEAYGDS